MIESSVSPQIPIARLMQTTEIKQIVPVLPSADLERDVKWYQEKLGFEKVFAHDGYAVLKREQVHLHLQWHADTPDDPLLGGSVIRIFVLSIDPVFQECLETGVAKPDKLRRNTPWNTHEFGLYDKNNNAIFFVEAIR